MNVRLPLVVFVLSVLSPAAALAQGVTVQGAFGSQLNGGGHNESIAVGLWPSNRVGIVVHVERIYLPTEVTQSRDVTSLTRGGKSSFVSGELRFVPRGLDRVSPYFLVGGGRGKTRPNVNDYFPDPVASYDAVQFIGGGGVHVPLARHLSLFGDMRFVFQAEDSESGVYLFLPVRGGIAVRF